MSGGGASSGGGLFQTLARQVRKAIVSPNEILPFFLGKLQVRRVEKDGQRFYRYRDRDYPELLNRGNAASFIEEKALTLCRGKGIDVGASDWPLPGAAAVQQERKRNALRMDDVEAGSLDFVFSSHCLEHVASWQQALSLWIAKLTPGGILFLYLPHEDMELWHPGAPWAGTSHKWIPTWQVLVPYLESQGMEIVDVERGRDGYWSFHVAARRKGPQLPAR